jgi:hypothetical protein
MAAVLAGGEGAALSHRSAASLWEIGNEESGRINISVRRRCELQRPGIRFHGRPSLRPEEILRRDDIPVTSPVQTLIDLAVELDSIPLERAVNEVDKRGLIDPETLREELARFSGEPGVRPLRLLLDKLFFRLSDSDLEIYFRRIVKRASLPPRSANSASTATRSTSSGPSWDWSWRRTAFAITAPPQRRPATPDGIAPTSWPA